MSELKPCPFCGGPARFMVHPVWQVQAYVCKLCGAIGPSAVSPSMAANLWNRRDERTCHIVGIPDQPHPWIREECDQCGELYDGGDYCPSCGAKVVWE